MQLRLWRDRAGLFEPSLVAISVKNSHKQAETNVLKNFISLEKATDIITLDKTLQFFFVSYLYFITIVVMVRKLQEPEKKRIKTKNIYFIV